MWLHSGNSTARRKVYLASPLFSDAEKTFNVLVAQGLEEGPTYTCHSVTAG